MGDLGLIVNFVLAALGTFALLALLGSIYQRAGRASDARLFPPLGRLIEIGGASLHVYTIGEGSPPVVFEAGIAATSLSWQLVQPEIAKFTQTASYDRAGLGWSSAGLQPRTIWNVANELRILLDRAEIPKPRILVGSFLRRLGCYRLCRAPSFRNRRHGSSGPRGYLRMGRTVRVSSEDFAAWHSALKTRCLAGPARRGAARAESAERRIAAAAENDCSRQQRP